MTHGAKAHPNQQRKTDMNEYAALVWLAPKAWLIKELASLIK